MGLLDSLGYGSGGGGLLDFLLQSQQQPPPSNGPSPFDNAPWPQGPMGAPSSAPPASFADRFNAIPGAPQPFQGAGRQFDQATFDPATYAPNQAQPIAVGNYQMPRMGSADQFSPAMNAQAMLPPNAQPTQGQLPVQQQMPQQAEQPLPPAFDGGGGIASALGRIGNPDGLIARLTGNDSRSVAQQNLTAQYHAVRQALIANGESPQAAASKAMIAAMNPEAAKTILPELFTNKQKYQVISEDPLEGKKYGFVNERDQTINDKPIGQAAPSGGGLAGIQAAQNAGVKGEALYEHLPVAMRNTVKAMLEGRQPLPSTTAMRSPATLAMIDAAHAIDPTFDATVWKARNEAGPDWTKGKSSEMVRAANQTLTHVNSLMNAADALHNRAMPAWNAAGNYINEQFGAGEPTSFRIKAHAVSEEMSKVFKGANLSDAEIKSWEKNLSENMSPTQQRAALEALSDLLHGSLSALAKKRSDALGPAAAAKAPPILDEQSQKIFERLDKWTKGEAAPPIKTAPNSTNLPNGWSVKVH